MSYFWNIYIDIFVDDIKVYIYIYIYIYIKVYIYMYIYIYIYINFKYDDRMNRWIIC